MDQGLNRKPNGWALLPFLIFIVIYLGAGLFLQRQGEEMAFYQFPSVTAMFLAVVAAFCMGKEKLDEKFSIFARGAANENVLTMLMIYILAGAFSTVAKSMGGVDATVNLGLAVIPVELLVAGMFVISAFLGTATGTSVGTITALVPIAVGLASESGLSVPLMLGACAGGAIKTQGVALKDKFRVNFYIALPAALITLVILLIIGRGGGAVLEPRSFDILKVVPYVLVLTLAILGVNVFLTLTLGIFSAGIIGLCAGDLTIFTFAQDIWNGFTGMSEVFFLALFCGGISELIAHNGGIVWLIEKLRKMMHGGKSAQIGMSVLVSLADCATANNTVAIILCGNVARDMSREFKVDPRRTASLLDVFSCVFQGIIPYGAQLLVAASLTTTYGIVISPVEIVPYMWYCWILAGFGLLSIFVPYADRTCRRDPWNWEYDVAESGVEAKKALLEKSRER